VRRIPLVPRLFGGLDARFFPFAGKSQTIPLTLPGDPAVPIFSPPSLLLPLQFFFSLSPWGGLFFSLSVPRGSLKLFFPSPVSLAQFHLLSFVIEANGGYPPLSLRFPVPSLSWAYSFFLCGFFAEG